MFRSIVPWNYFSGKRERVCLFLNYCITVALDKKKGTLKAAVFCQFFPEVSRWEKIANFKVVSKETTNKRASNT